MLIVASFFVLWEAEVAAATTGHLHFDMDKEVTTLTLIVSKTDVNGSTEITCSSRLLIFVRLCRRMSPVSHEQWRCSYQSTKAKLVATIQHFNA